jgi:hypothetical protein
MNAAFTLGLFLRMAHVRPDPPIVKASLTS